MVVWLDEERYNTDGLSTSKPKLLPRKKGYTN